MKNILKKRDLASFLVIISFLLILQTPMIWNHSVNFSGDALFHYNRFYDAMMQIKQHNFQPLYTFYGFHSTMRVTNAIYSPVLAYFLGIIAWVSGSWFKFDLIVNTLMGISIAVCFWRLFNLQRLSSYPTRILIILLALTSNNYISWIMQHQFNTIGAIPLILIVTIIVRMYQDIDRPINTLELTFSMALVTQTHMLSTIFAILLLIPSTLVATFWWKNKLLNWKKIMLSVIGTIILTTNIWIPYIYLTSRNKISTPGASKISDNITHFMRDNYNWNGTITIALSTVIFVVLTIGILCWKKNNRTTKVLLIISWILLFLQTNIVPWDYISSNFNFINILQFPFRFNFILIITVLSLIAQYLSDYEKIVSKSHKEVLLIFISGFALMNFMIVYQNIWESNQNYLQNTSAPIQNPDNGLLGSVIEARKSFTEHNLQESLLKNSRGTSDYLTGTNGSYKDYNSIVFVNNYKYDKKVINSQVILKWRSDEQGRIVVPIAYYSGLISQLNGTPIDNQTDAHGFLVVNSKKGNNQLIVEQDTPTIIYVSYLVPALFLTVLLAFVCYKKLMKSRI
ncbi:hypothetical protein [Leuconostoc citreum]